MQIRPLEEAYKFGDFFSSYLNESDFHAKPSVLLLGQYSTGVILATAIAPSTCLRSQKAFQQDWTAGQSKTKLLVGCREDHFCEAPAAERVSWHQHRP